MEDRMLRSYTEEAQEFTERAYFRAFRRKLPRGLERIAVCSRDKFEKAYDILGKRPSKYPIGFAYSFRSFVRNYHFICVEEDHELIVLTGIGHELFHIFFKEELWAGNLDQERADAYVVEEAFAHLGSKFFFDQVLKDDWFGDGLDIQYESNQELPYGMHRKAYRLTDLLVKHFSPFYFKPVKRLLLEGSVDEILECSGLNHNNITKPKKRKKN